MKTYTIEKFSNERPVIILQKSERGMITLVNAPGVWKTDHVEYLQPGEKWTGKIDWEGEGPYAILYGEKTGHDQRLIENYIIRKPGQTHSDALDEFGLDEGNFIPHY